ncbi:hypothetical protein HER32_08400 [Hymenobacter sp. BT18]|uniref:hypothetical protein n=1 Tax=Hymenobacter sp. BT18 TaxID=2835648 RepID=UPI00143EE1DF|nr:hypothetical protein [Hymenobacter sp. BT18]QIX61199.1 hypothetical protein HER32_08400 [Hymenobacter sp. BT18]
MKAKIPETMFRGFFLWATYELSVEEQEALGFLMLQRFSFGVDARGRAGLTALLRGGTRFIAETAYHESPIAAFILPGSTPPHTSTSTRPSFKHFYLLVALGLIRIHSHPALHTSNIIGRGLPLARGLLLGRWRFKYRSGRPLWGISLGMGFTCKADYACGHYQSRYQVLHAILIK